MATNASILEQNICHAFGALRNAEIAEDAFWRFRNAHAPCCAERLAYLAAKHDALVAIALKVTLPMLPAVLPEEAGRDWRIRIELGDFVRERIHHYDRACTCKGE